MAIGSLSIDKIKKKLREINCVRSTVLNKLLN